MNLSKYSYWNVGGKCEDFNEVHDKESLVSVLKRNNSKKTLVIGSGTNLLFDSRGFKGKVIKLGRGFDFIERINSTEVEVGASMKVPKLVRSLSRIGLAGIDHCVGIPASVGGLVAMNGGSQRKAISSNIKSVKVIDYNGKIFELDNYDCDFSYRNSVFLKNDWIIISVVLKLETIQKNSNRKNLLKIMKERRKKFPRKEPNCGSVFKSSKELYDSLGPPGFIIESLGLKGLEIGGAKISDKHANFIVNNNHATSNDILQLVSYINERCFNHYNFTMDAEPIYISEDGNKYPLDKAPKVS